MGWVGRFCAPATFAVTGVSTATPSATAVNRPSVRVTRARFLRGFVNAFSFIVTSWSLFKNCTITNLHRRNRSPVRVTAGSTDFATCCPDPTRDRILGSATAPCK